MDKDIQMQVPHVNFRVRELGEWVDTNTDTYFKGKRVIVFSLPGAFTPTCSNQQLPGYEKQADVFKDHNIDEIYCVSVNDSFVMNAWATDQKLENVKVIPDGNGQFTQEMGMLCQKRDKCFGQRSWRYAMIVNDGVVEQMFVEPGKKDDSTEDPYGESSPENVLKYLKGFKG
jgi:peroxiredoxin